MQNNAKLFILNTFLLQISCQNNYITTHNYKTTHTVI